MLSGCLIWKFRSNISLSTVAVWPRFWPTCAHLVPNSHLAGAWARVTAIKLSGLPKASGEALIGQYQGGGRLAQSVPSWWERILGGVCMVSGFTVVEGVADEGLVIIRETVVSSKSSNGGLALPEHRCCIQLVLDFVG